MATLGNNFNLEERQRLLDQSIANANEVDTDGTLRITVTANREEGSNKNPFLQNLENIDRNTFDDNITNGLNLGPYSQVESGIKYFEEAGLVGGKEEKKKDVTKLRSNRTNPLRKIAGGRVLQYPIDLDTDIQDYFEIQVFNYRPAGSLPSVKYSNQGSNSGNFAGGYYSGSNLRGNRQNFRLQDLQSTIQLPVPPSLKDMNAVDFGGQSMSGFAAAIFGPVVASFLGRGGDPNSAAAVLDAKGISRIRLQAQNLLMGGFLKDRPAEAKAAAEMVFDKYSRLADRRDKPAGVLSGGERRLLEISRALVMQPQVLLVDEPSIGLEPRFIDMVFGILDDLQKKDGKTIIMVEQNAKKGLAFADIGYVLVSGETAIADSGNDLLENPDVGRLFLGG